jgi:hypothetical protein
VGGENLEEVMTLQLPIDEYFKYHPPTTPERIALHDRVNRESLEICKSFIDSQDFNHWLAFRDAAILLAQDVCQDKTCHAWAKSAIVKALGTYSIANIDARSTAILMYIQQFRMFLNQGITVDELKRQQLAEGMAAVTTEDIAEIFRMHGEAVPVSNDPDRFNITPAQLVERTIAIQKEIDRRFNNIIHLTLDGNKWCALIGENLQVGIAGFGDDPIAALSDLYAKLEGLGFGNTVNAVGVKTAVSIFKAQEKSELFSDFINAYGKALFVRLNEGFTKRELLIAEWIGDNSVKD